MRKKRATVCLSGLLEQRLIGYAAAASAAGVGVLACSVPAQSKVVSTLSWTQIIPGSTVPLDLNNDGVPDFQFSNRTYDTSVGRVRYGVLKILPQQGNAIWGTGGSASALGSGVTIGSNTKLQAGHQFMVRGSLYRDYYSAYGSIGNWKQITRMYLGFKFTIQGQVHYGWARLNVAPANGGVYAAVTKYAYETEPNTPIITGQDGGASRKKSPPYRRGPVSHMPVSPTTGTLGDLAGGAVTVSRRKELNAGKE